MQRKLYSSLLDWKCSDDRKPLILEGARQVGKTYLLKEFGRNEYDNLVYINCHDNGEIKSIKKDHKRGCLIVPCILYD